ncbi:MFS general substrate transporter [Roridomyces roridus]|uniref:MFS general substrate transporter n=1 Tax=Roridomyces roridus TaxID=1738132 RepID=A0AAD7B6Z5_9AGAR|nr:MFS general substrate transporter [Roridomyces roridus]
MKSSSASGHTDEKNGSSDFGGVEVTADQLDTGAQLLYGHHHELDPQEANRVRRKIDMHIMPLMMILYWIQFMDKATLGNASILGIIKSTKLTTNQYNWLGTIFYLSYLAFEFPQNLCLQRFPVAKWMSVNIFVWAVALACHAACTNFGGLFAVRFVLGMCEGSITAGFLLVTAMFYTRTEQTLRVGYWFLMNGTAQIIAGFISFGCLHIKTETFEPWQWLMIITAILTLIMAVLFWFFFPDSPTTCWFLTPEERITAVLRIKVNQTGVENKHFKKEQLIEALVDPKTWLFAFFAAVTNVTNALVNQRQLIVASFGFTPLQTTLLGCVDGVIEIVTIAAGVILAARIPNSRAYVGCISICPSILAVFLINFLPWSNKIGLLFSQWLTGFDSPSFVLVLSWVSCVTAGHTKRITVNAILLGAYCVGNAVGPFMFQAKYKPRNHVPWIIIGCCYLTMIVTLLGIRFYMAAQNKKREEEPVDETYDHVYVQNSTDSGAPEKIDMANLKEYLDLTDIQNRDFRYVL